MQNGPGSAATPTTGPEKSAAAKPLTSTAQSSGLDASIAALVAQLLGSVPREFYDEVIAGCTADGHAHRHHVGHDEAAPVTRRVRCGDGRSTTYMFDLGGAR
jgi:hypothetical protein